MRLVFVGRPELNRAFLHQFWPYGFGSVPKWSNGADCKSAGIAFGGSNPSRPTKNLLANSPSFLPFPLILILRRTRWYLATFAGIAQW